MGIDERDTGMDAKELRLVILADRHHGMAEGMRSLLETMFGAVIMVADESSLLESAASLHPTAVVADLSLSKTENLGWLKQLRARCPKTKLVLLSIHDESSVCARVMDAGADGFVVKRAVATDLLLALDAVLAGRQYVSPAVPAREPGPGGSRTSVNTRKDAYET